MAWRKGVGKTETFRLVVEFGCLEGKKRDRGCPGRRKRDGGGVLEEGRRIRLFWRKEEGLGICPG